MDGALLCKVSRRDLNRYSPIDSDPRWALNRQQAVDHGSRQKKPGQPRAAWETAN